MQGSCSARALRTYPTRRAPARRGLLRLPALLAAACAAACGGPDEPAARRIVLIVADATHAAHLGCYGGPEGLTPNLDALAERGVRFERAFANNAWTLPSTATLLTGQLAETHGVLTNHHRAEEDLELLPEIFAEAGFATAAFVQMLYASKAYGLDQGFDHYVYTGFTEAANPLATFEAAAAWIEEHRDERFFLYLHLRRPHSPYNPRPKDAIEILGPWPFEEWQPPQRAVHADVLEERELPDEERDAIQYLYRANLATVDRQLAAVLDLAGSLEETLVVVTSDHGEGLGQHGFYGHGGRLWAEVVDVPLVFAGASLAPRVDEAPAATIDVAPTLVELAGLRWPAGVPLDGRSLAPRLLGRPEGPRPPIPLSSRYSDDSAPPEVALVAGPLKLVLEPDGDVRLSNRLADPEERALLDLGGEPEAAELLEMARALRERGLGRAARGRVDPQLTQEQLEELRALGYAGDG